MQTFAFFVYFFVVSYASGSYVQPSVWPNPASITFGDITYGEMDSNIPFVVTDGTSSTLMMAYDRYQKLMFPHPVNTTTASTQIVRVTVANLSDAYPQLSTNESYTITISPPSSSSELVIDITAETVYGTLRAYETLSQLISYDFSTNKYSVPYSLNVRDSPRFPHRGILLDTSRHFMPISTLQLFVDSLVYAKFNVLHWHVVDTQSFPYQSVARPNLWFGAYSLWERYSQQEIKNLIEYARQRGVKIMIEFDMPGHGASWCKGYPEICPAADCPQPLNPASDETFKVINDLMAEITGHDSYTAYDPNQPPAASFPYELLHLGGDEVSENYPCWDNNPAIVSWQQARGLDDDGTYLYFVNGTAAVARANERTAVQWVEVFEEFGSALNKDTVVHVWKDKSTLNNVLQAGYKAIISDQADWYLDHEDVTWEQMYRNEPTQGLSPGIDVDALLIGGEACMWDERVDPSVVFNTVWPRAAAVAER
jgi:hexosaminidase